MEIIINNTMLKVAKIVDINHSHHTKKEWYLCDMMEGLVNTMVPVILHYISVSNQHIAHLHFSSVQSHSRVQLCNPMNRSTPGLPVHHQFTEFTQTHVHQVSDAIQPSHPLSSTSPPVPNPSQHQGLFKWVSSSHWVAKVVEFQLHHQSFQWTPRTDLL